jgi:hypothetical protein
LRVLPLPAYALDAVWVCHAALVQDADGDDDGEALARLLSPYLVGVHTEASPETRAAALSRSEKVAVAKYAWSGNERLGVLRVAR